MASPNYPNTTGISAGIVTFVEQNVSFTLVGSTTAQTYVMVKQGSLKDITDSLPCLTVEAARGSSQPYSSGGGSIGWRRDEVPTFRLSSYVDFTDATIAEQNILIIRDALIFALTTYYTLGGVSNPQGVQNVYVTEFPVNGEQFLYRDMGNGVVYRAHICNLIVKSQWNVLNLAR